MQHIKHFTDVSHSIYASISVDTHARLMLCMWRGERVDDKQVLDVLKYCCEQVRHYQLRHWLNDVSRLDGDSPIFAQDKHLLVDLQNTDLERFAFVSKRASHWVPVAWEHVLKSCQVKIQAFSHFAAAIEWLILPQIDDAIWDQSKTISF